MNYPAWDVPLINSGWVVGAIAIFHVLISHFAVGGGFYMPIAERKARREGREDWLRVLKGNAKFFLVLTAVMGTVTGVGIWFAIGLANPEATSTLIHNFVFAWAIEWAFFFIEVTSIAVYYYSWDKLPAKEHMLVGWVYAGSAWLSLVVINGILTFMLTPGEAWLAVAGTGQEASKFWMAFFNPTYWPSLVLRTVACIGLAGLFAFVTASRIDADKQGALKEEVMRWSAKWLIPAFVAMPFCFVWYLWMVPESQRALLQLGVSTMGAGVFTQLTRTVLVTVATCSTIAVIVALLVWRGARSFSLVQAVILLLLAQAAVASTEYAREMLRKPYVIGNHLYASNVRVNEAKAIDERGYLARSPWVRASEREAWQDPPSPASQAAHLAMGELVLRGQCRACHTLDGYRSLRRLFAGRDRAGIGNILTLLHDYPDDSPYRKYMPPLAGNEAEVQALGDYLDAVLNGLATDAPPATAAAPSDAPAAPGSAG